MEITMSLKKKIKCKKKKKSSFYQEGMKGTKTGDFLLWDVQLMGPSTFDQLD